VRASSTGSEGKGKSSVLLGKKARRERGKGRGFHHEGKENSEKGGCSTSCQSLSLENFPSGEILIWERGKSLLSISSGGVAFLKLS